MIPTRWSSALAMLRRRMRRLAAEWRHLERLRRAAKHRHRELPPGTNRNGAASPSPSVCRQELTNERSAGTTP